MVTFEVRRPEAMELCDVHFQNNPEAKKLLDTIKKYKVTK